MLYQTAKSELQSPPHSISLVALVSEAGTAIVVAMLLTWLV